MTTISIAHDRVIDAPSDAVWAVVADYSRDHEWRSGVISMVPTPAGLVRPGTTTVEHIRLGGRSYENRGEVLEVAAGRSFRWRTTSGAEAHGGREVEPLDGGRSRLRLELVVTARGAERLLAPVLGRMLDRNVRRDLERLAELVTREATRLPA